MAHIHKARVINPVATEPPPPVGQTGRLTGPFGMWKSDTALQDTESSSTMFTIGLDFTSKANLLPRIAAARSKNQSLILAPTGGLHTLYTSDDGNGNQRFDFDKWKHGTDLQGIDSDRGMDCYGTAQIQDAVAEAYEDGTITAINLLDEPQHESWDEGNTGWMTKAKVDLMADYCRTVFPGIPVWCVVLHFWRPTQTYTSLDGIITQYGASSISSGLTYQTFLDGAMQRRPIDKVQIITSLNVLDGGTRISGCPEPQTGGPGTFGNNCRMTAAQVEESGLLLGSHQHVRALLYWRTNTTMFSKTSYRAKFQLLADHLAGLSKPAASDWFRFA